MKKINIKKACGITLASCALLLGTSSCNDYLDVDRYIYDLPTIDTAFNSKVNLIKFVNGASTWLPDEATFYYDERIKDKPRQSLPFQGASDENFSSWNDAAHDYMPFLLGFETQFSGSCNRYSDWYTGIRAANLILKRIGEVPDLSDIDIRVYTGEAYFLRGYYYFQLFQQYGPIPLLPKTPLDINENIDDLKFERSSYDDCVEAICRDMELAAEYLPQDVNQTEPYRPTSGVALAVMSRLRLMAASPWYNGNTRYSGWKRSDGTHFISQTNDNSKWAKAAVAAYRIIQSGRYSIYTYKKLADSPALDPSVSKANYPDGAGDIDIYKSYADMFTGDATLMTNTEAIWIQSQGNEWTSREGTPVFLGGHNSLNLTQGAVDAFRRKDGTDPKTDKSSPYYVPSDQLADPISYDQEFAGYALKAAAPKMYNNMEMRFYASVGFCHRFWKCTSYNGAENYRNVEVTYYSDGNAYPHETQKDNKNYSGYTLTKYTNQVDSWRGDGKRIAKIFAKYRYAEVLLNYAEALNELNQPYTIENNGQTYGVSRDLAKIKSALNQIRYRSGLPGVKDSEISTQEAAREFIKRERQVEFFCEGRRYHDLRRWGDAQDAYSKKITGMNVSQPSSNRKEFFKETELSTPFAARRFSFKNYFWPIPYSAIKQNSKLVQNPGW